MTKDELFQALKEIHEICKNRMASMMDCKSCLFFDKLKEFDEEKEVYDHHGLSIEDVTENDDGVYIE